MSVPFFSTTHSFTKQWPLIEEKLDRVIDTGQFTNGPMVKELERAIEVFTGAKHAIAVGNATDALIIIQFLSSTVLPRA